MCSTFQILTVSKYTLYIHYLYLILPPYSSETEAEIDEEMIVWNIRSIIDFLMLFKNVPPTLGRHCNCYEPKLTFAKLPSIIATFLVSWGWVSERFLLDYSFKGSAWFIMCAPPSVWQGYSRELFQFEEDRFDNVPALIRFYVGGRRPISQASGAVIFHPITRTLPLRVITEQHSESTSSSSSRGSGREGHNEANKRRSFSSTHNDTLQVINPLLRWEGVC